MAGNANQIVKSTKTRQEIAQEYGIDRKTFYRWMKKAGLPVTNGLLYPLKLEGIGLTLLDSYYRLPRVQNKKWSPETIQKTGRHRKAIRVGNLIHEK